MAKARPGSRPEDLREQLPYATARQAEVARAVIECGSKSGAARVLGISERNVRATVARMREQAEAAGWKVGQVATPPPPVEHVAPDPEANAKRLRQRLQELESERESIAEIKRLIHGMQRNVQAPPKWIHTPKRAHRRGVPTLFLSDLHWGERVFRDQTNGLNQYDMEIAARRLRKVVETSVQLLHDEFREPDYPGIVVLLGGDMVSGNIHEELRESNDQPILPTMIDLHAHLRAALGLLAEQFGRVCVFSVVGNHGRLDKKPRAKFGAPDNFEWLLYEMLAQSFAGDDRLAFQNASGFDLHFSIYSHRYLLNHGDKTFRGGTGITGPLLPWVRGHQKKQQQYRPVGLGYDTLCIGHWHNLNYLSQNSIIVNGSLKGMDEWSMSMGFDFQTPEQALWITHPVHGITYPMSVAAEEPKTKPAVEWVKWAAAI